MSYYENSRKTFAAGAAIAHQSVVKLGAAGVEACGADGTHSVLWKSALGPPGELVSVRLINTPGTVEVRAGGQHSRRGTGQPGSGWSCGRPKRLGSRGRDCPDRCRQ